MTYQEFLAAVPPIAPLLDDDSTAAQREQDLGDEHVDGTWTEFADGLVD